MAADLTAFTLSMAGLGAGAGGFGHAVHAALKWPGAAYLVYLGVQGVAFGQSRQRARRAGAGSAAQGSVSPRRGW